MSRSLMGLVALLVALPVVGLGDTLEDRFQSANAFFAKKRFPEAKKEYEGLIRRYQVRAAAVYYNLGNAEIELGNLGRAVLSYKRALDMSPEPDLERRIRDNLSHATDAIIERYRQDPTRSVTVLDETHGVFYSVFHLMPAAVSGYVWLGCWVALFGLLTARRLTSVRPELLRTAAIATAIPMLLAGTFFIGRAVTGESVTRGIIVKDNIRLREGRGGSAEESDIPEGLEVRILDATDPGETEVSLSNGKRGWVPAKAVEAI